MLLDIVHAALGLVSTSILSTLLQVASRIFIVVLIIPFKNKNQQFCIHDSIMFLAWSVTEVVRYNYYAYKDSRIMKLLRYNLFLILYPVGVIGGEIPLIYQHFKQTKKLIDLAALAVYVPFFPYLYVYMIGQRKKALAKIDDTEKKDE